MHICCSHVFVFDSPNSVHTVGVLAVTLGLAVCWDGDLRVYARQLLCAGAVLRACRLAPVQAKRSVASLSSEKHNGFITLFLSAQKVVLVAQGMPQMPSEGSWSAPGALSGILLPGFFPQDSSSEIPPQEILLEDSSPQLPPPGFHLKDSSLRSPPPVFLL